MLTKTLQLLFLSLICFYANAQKLTGKISNEKGQPLAGVTISATTATVGATSDVEGRFSISLEADKKHVLQFSIVGYQTKMIEDVEVKQGIVEALDVMMVEMPKEMTGVVVRTTARRESVQAMIQVQKNSNTVAQVVSAEAIRKSPDRNTSEVLKRVSGTSIQEGKYLVIRGLADRYNQATINGAMLSSTEPDRKTFAFDIFPSNIIDNIVINKAAVPELPGEFSGGLVQLNTKDGVDRNFMTVSLGGGINTQVIGSNFLTYQGGRTDWLGIDDGTRGLPSAFPSLKQMSSTFETDKLASYGRLLNDNWGFSNRTGLFNRNIQLTGGKGFNLGNSGRKISSIFSLSYNQQFRSLNRQNNFYESDGNMRFAYNDEYSTENIMMGGIANFNYQAPKFKLSFKNSYNVTATDQYIVRTGIDNSNQAMVNALGYQSAFRSNRLLNSQLNGEHALGSSNRLRLKWNANASMLDQDVPDLKNITYHETTLSGKTSYRALINQNNANAKDAGRFFSELSDIIYGGGANASYNFKMFNQTQVFKVGGLYQRKTRDFQSRVFGIRMANISDDILTLPIHQIFSREYYSAANFHLFEITTPSNNYDAEVNLGAGYIQFDNQFSDKLKLTWGVRAEAFNQSVQFITSAGPVLYIKDYLDFLPSINLNYLLTEKSNIRLSGSRTVSRPEFREITPFSFFDFEKNGTIYGQPNLERAVITNADARYEIYPRAGEMITFGLFYKYFDKPIESSYGFAAGSPIFSFTNAKAAENFGAEVELRKKLDFTKSEFLNSFTFFTNLAYIKSSVTFDENVADQLERPMQGQSPYVINAGLQYDNINSGTSATTLFNMVGSRIYQVGFPGFGNIYEAPRPILDFQITQKIAKRSEIKFTVSDILNRPADFFQDSNGTGRRDSNDKIFHSLRYGTTFGLNFVHNF